MITPDFFGHVVWPFVESLNTEFIMTWVLAYLLVMLCRVTIYDILVPGWIRQDRRVGLMSLGAAIAALLLLVIAYQPAGFAIAAIALEIFRSSRWPNKPLTTSPKNPA